MHFLSDSYRLRDAILAERAEERAKSKGTPLATEPVAPKAAAGNPRAGTNFLRSLAGRLPRVSLDGKVK